MNQPIASAHKKKGQGAKRSAPTQGSRFSHWLGHHRREAKASFARLASAPVATFMTVLVMALALALPLGLAQLLDDARAIAGDWDADARLSVYLKMPLSETDQARVHEQIQALTGVKKATLITPQQALDDLRERSDYGTAIDQLGENPLPAVIDVLPKQATDPELMQQLRDELVKWPEVETADVDIAWVQRLRSALDVGERLLLALASTMILGGVLVVGNTIRLSIEARREEIRIISLLGATNAFVRRPFLYMGFWCGLGAGVLTLVSVNALIIWLSTPVDELARLYASQFQLSSPDLVTSAVVLLGATLLGLMGAWFAAARHMRELAP